MTEHLPECFNTAHMTAVDAPCICDRLRACEERVTRAVMHTVDVDSYEQGHRDALAAAREAVAALPEYRMRDTCVAAIDALKEASDD